VLWRRRQQTAAPYLTIQAFKRSAFLLSMTSTQKPIDGCGKWNFAENGPDEVYDGQWKDGLMHGKGVYIFQSGAIYDGDFLDGKQHGKGVIIYCNGASYEGDWKFGLQHGMGKFTHTNVLEYEGEFARGFMHGLGTCTYLADGAPTDVDLGYSWSAGDKMECEVKKSVRHGACTYTFFNAETFRCTWVDGRCAEFSARQRLVLASTDPKRAAVANALRQMHFEVLFFFVVAV
jgi:hypothetical protein